MVADDKNDESKQAITCTTDWPINRAPFVRFGGLTVADCRSVTAPWVRLKSNGLGHILSKFANLSAVKFPLQFWFACSFTMENQFYLHDNVSLCPCVDFFVNIEMNILLCTMMCEPKMGQVAAGGTNL
jgi:hypothetical protein